jgi:hypothetical protein
MFIELKKRQKTKKSSMVLDRERTIPTVLLVGEVIANFCG